MIFQMGLGDCKRSDTVNNTAGLVRPAKHASMKYGLFQDFCFLPNTAHFPLNHDSGRNKNNCWPSWTPLFCSHAWSWTLCASLVPVQPFKSFRFVRAHYMTPTPNKSLLQGKTLKTCHGVFAAYFKWSPQNGWHLRMGPLLVSLWENHIWAMLESWGCYKWHSVANPILGGGSLAFIFGASFMMSLKFCL